MAYTYNVHTPKRSIATFDRASVAFFSPFEKIKILIVS